jgi:co-chaperonin GroES (HSP10)
MITFSRRNSMQNRSSKGFAVRNIEYEGNHSGWEAVDYKVIIQKDEVQETTAGGIIIAEEYREQEWWNVFTGILVSKGELAFTEGRDRDGRLLRWENEPKVGDRVMLRERAGIQFTGEDGKQYALYQDKDIGGIKA